MARLTRGFYRRDPVVVAKALLGQRLVRVLDMPKCKRLAGTIVEVEAYLGVPDKAAHTCNGRHTKRNESMWGDGGHAYVYFTYGMHYCMNVVASEADEPVAVLIRALEPTEGVEVMYERRKAAKKAADLCSGPAKLCQALGIDRELDGHDLVKGSRLYIEQVRKTALPGFTGGHGSADRGKLRGRVGRQTVTFLHQGSCPRQQVEMSDSIDWTTRTLPNTEITAGPCAWRLPMLAGEHATYVQAHPSLIVVGADDEDALLEAAGWSDSWVGGAVGGCRARVCPAVGRRGASADGADGPRSRRCTGATRGGPGGGQEWGDAANDVFAAGAGRGRQPGIGTSGRSGGGMVESKRGSTASRRELFVSRSIRGLPGA